MSEQLPRGWRAALVGDLASLIQYGTSAKTSDDASGVPVLRMGNILDGRLNFSNLKYLPPHHSEFPSLLLEPGDVLFNRTNSAELVGKTAVFQPMKLSPFSFASYLIRIRLRAYEPQLFAAFLNSALGREWIRSCVKQQVGQANVSGGALRRLELPVPPANEQRRIVAKLESLQARIRRAREALSRIEDLEEVLVRAWTRPGMKLSPLGPHLVEKTKEVGNCWRDYPLVGLSNEGRITQRRESIGQKTAHRCKLVEPGDIVFNPIRLSIGSITRHRGKETAIVSPEYQVMSTLSTLSSELLVRYLRSRYGRSTLQTETTGSVRYRVYYKDLSKLTIPLADAAEQARRSVCWAGFQPHTMASRLSGAILWLLTERFSLKPFEVSSYLKTRTTNRPTRCFGASPR